MTSPRRKLIVIERCCPRSKQPGCPNATNDRTPGAGYAVDWFCTAAAKRMIVGYVEWDSELPKDGDFPDWCPLFEAEPGMYV